MLQWVRMIAGLLSDVLTLGILWVRTSTASRAENLALRRQLARYIERGIKPRRVDHEIRVSLALFSRLYEWRNALVSVRPSTVVRWHRRGWRICWRWKCRAGRPPLSNYLFKSVADAFEPQKAAEAGYTHLIASAKKNKDTAEKLERRLKRDYPEAYERCMAHNARC